ncbi:MAG: FAD:protein FMN transferase [Chitinophagaceae bacterium]
MALCCLYCVCSHAQLQRFSSTRSKMGSPFTIILYAPDSTIANTTINHAFELVDSLVNILSDYIDSSELNRLCARAGHSSFVCSPVLFDALQQSADAYKKSSGSFDITLGPLTRLWRKARKEKVFPPDELVQQKKTFTGFTKLQLDNNTHTAFLQQAGMQLDLGGIGQGYIAQQTMNYLKTQHIDNALVDVSGDIVTIGSPPSKDGWTVAINLPEREALLPKHISISNKAVTTSGDVYQYMEHEGKRYSHIIDPKTGYGITSQKNVTVIAADGTIADWLTKACSILSVSKAKQLARKLHAEVLIAVMKNEKPVFYASRDFWKSSMMQLR